MVNTWKTSLSDKVTKVVRDLALEIKNLLSQLIWRLDCVDSNFILRFPQMQNHHGFRQAHFAKHAQLQWGWICYEQYLFVHTDVQTAVSGLCKYWEGITWGRIWHTIVLSGCKLAWMSWVVLLQLMCCPAGQTPPAFIFRTLTESWAGFRILLQLQSSLFSFNGNEC